MIRKDWKERPAVQVWRDLVKGKWWTNAKLKTNANGEAATHAFYGTFEVTVSFGKVQSKFTIKHNAGGSPVKLPLPTQSENAK